MSSTFLNKISFRSVVNNKRELKSMYPIWLLLEDDIYHPHSLLHFCYDNDWLSIRYIDTDWCDDGSSEVSEWAKLDVNQTRVHSPCFWLMWFLFSGSFSLDPFVVRLSSSFSFFRLLLFLLFLFLLCFFQINIIKNKGPNSYIRSVSIFPIIKRISLYCHS
jgi:hypothetical protein